MKNILFALALTLYNIQYTLAVPNSGSELEQALRDTSKDPSLASIVSALLIVIFLIYITGIIYSKLNAVGSKAAREQFKNYDLNKAIVLSTTQLGQNRNLHVIEINDKCYLIGATPNSVNLIKELGTVENNKNQEYEKPEDVDIDKAIRVLYGKNEEIIESEAQPSDTEEFDVHKKYL